MSDLNRNRSGWGRDFAAGDAPKQDKRWCPRFKLNIELTVYSREGTLSGRTVDISESGIAAILPIETRLGETVELIFQLPLGRVRILAVARQRSAFRWGFQFVDPDSFLPLIRHTLHRLPGC